MNGSLNLTRSPTNFSYYASRYRFLIQASTMISLTLDDLPSSLRATLARQTLNAGEILLQHGDAARYLYWVTTGRVRLVSFVNQQMVTHYFVDAEDFLGESALYVPQYICTVIAETASEVIPIPVDDFAAALKAQPALSERYMAHLTKRFYAVKSLLELRSINSARDRLLKYLIPRLGPNQYTVTLDKPLRAVASELALTPEALSRLLSRLESEGAISRQRRAITFYPEWLEDIAEY
ncbi:MAG: Crp/Fnr family transcriptional regulator [Leptolyngbyaceae cyanobacterium]